MKVRLSNYLKTKDRKVNVEIEHFDTYSLDHTLALIILPALIQYKNNNNGIPSEFSDVGGDPNSMQESFSFYTDTHVEAFEEGVRKWEEVIDKMIWSFQQIVEDQYQSKYHHGSSDILWKKSDEEFYNPVTGKMEKAYDMIETDPDARWYDINGYEEHERRVQEGLELFGKYYRNLWT